MLLITIDDRDVLLSSKSDSIEDAETGAFDYEQIAMNSIADEWQNTFDFNALFAPVWFVRSLSAGTLSYLLSLFS